MGYHLRLVKARSYCGIVTATRQKPDVFTEEKTVADAAVASGYFKLIEATENNSSGKVENPGRGQYEEMDGSLDLFKDIGFDSDTISNMAGSAVDIAAECTGNVPETDFVPNPLTEEEQKAAETSGEEEEPGTTGEEKRGRKTLEEMTVSELETFAAYKGVCLKGISKKADILAKLKEELGEIETENGVDYGSPTMTDLQKQ